MTFKTYKTEPLCATELLQVRSCIEETTGCYKCLDATTTLSITLDNQLRKSNVGSTTALELGLDPQRYQDEQFVSSCCCHQEINAYNMRCRFIDKVLLIPTRNLRGSTSSDDTENRSNVAVSCGVLAVIGSIILTYYICFKKYTCCKKSKNSIIETNENESTTSNVCGSNDNSSGNIIISSNQTKFDDDDYTEEFDGLSKDETRDTTHSSQSNHDMTQDPDDVDNPESKAEHLKRKCRNIENWNYHHKKFSDRSLDAGLSKNQAKGFEVMQSRESSIAAFRFKQKLGHKSHLDGPSLHSIQSTHSRGSLAIRELRSSDHSRRRVSLESGQSDSRLQARLSRLGNVMDSPTKKWERKSMTNISASLRNLGIDLDDVRSSISISQKYIEKHESEDIIAKLKVDKEDLKDRLVRLHDQIKCVEQELDHFNTQRELTEDEEEQKESCSKQLNDLVGQRAEVSQHLSQLEDAQEEEQDHLKAVEGETEILILEKESRH